MASNDAILLQPLRQKTDSSSVPTQPPGSGSSDNLGSDHDVKSRAESTADDDEDTGHDNEALPDAFKDDGLLVWLPPVPSPISCREMTRWSTWQIRRSVIIVSSLWACLVLDFLSRFFANGSHSTGHPRLIPMILATVLAAVASHIGYRDMLVFSSHSAHRLTYFQIGITVCVLAPLLSMPISSGNDIPDSFDLEFDRMYYTQYAPNFETPSGRSRQLDQIYYPLFYHTLKSWGPAMETAHFPIPRLMPESFGDGYDSYDTPSHWATKGTRWTDWSPEKENLEPIAFTLPRSGQGPNETLWHGDQSETTAMTLPVTITTNLPLAKYKAIVEARSRGPYVAITLTCDLLDLRVDGKIQETEKGLEVHATNRQGCSGELLLKKRPPPVRMTQILDTLNEVRQIIIGRSTAGQDVGNKQRSLRLLDGYIKLVQNSSSGGFTSYMPGWAPAHGISPSCRRKTIIAGTTRAIMFSSELFSHLGPHDIQAASCTPQYYSFNAFAFSSQFLGNTMMRDPGRDLGILEADLDHVLLGHAKELTEITEGRGDDNRLFEFLDGFFFGQVVLSLRAGDGFTRTHLVGPSLKAHLLDELDDIYWSRPVPLGTLLMGGRTLRQSFTEGIIDAASLALKEAYANNHNEDYKNRSASNPRMFVAPSGLGMAFVEVMLRVIYPIITTITFILRSRGSIVILACILAYGITTTITDDLAALLDMELPLSRHSLLARAALLCNTRIRALLRRIPDPVHLVEVSATLYLGSLDSNDGIGKGRLRIETLATARKGMYCFDI